MRLLVVTQYFWPESFRINDVVAELTRRGHDVTVLTGVPNYPSGRVFPDFARDPEAFSCFIGVPILRVPLVPRGEGNLRLVINYVSFVVSASTIGAWKLRGKGFDAIFVFMISPITAVLPAVLMRRLKGAPLCVWILDLWPETLSAVGAVKSPRILGWVGRLVSFIYRRTDRILVQSKGFMANVRLYAGESARVSYFPAWAEPAFETDLGSVETAPEMQPFEATFNVVFAGNIGEAQDFPSILDAAEALDDCPDVRWLILGDGRAADWVRSEIPRRNLTDRVVMLGRHPVERMPSFFRGANALLVTLRRDPIFTLTIPGKVQSYLAAGIPVLGMLDGEGARVINEAQAGLVCPAGSGAQLADCVRVLRKMPPRQRAEMGARGQDYCNREFNRDRLISKLEGWFREEAGHAV